MNGKWEDNGGSPFTGRFTLEYDHNDRFIKAKSYDGNVVLDNCVFTYKNGKIIREDWTDPATGDVIAQTNITYNRRGWIMKKDDPLCRSIN